MFGKDILRGILKVPFEMPHRISDPYIERCQFHLDMDKSSKELVSVFEMSPDLWFTFPDSKVHGANMGPIWVLLAPDGPHVGPMNFAIRVSYIMLHVLPYYAVL